MLTFHMWMPKYVLGNAETLLNFNSKKIFLKNYDPLVNIKFIHFKKKIVKSGNFRLSKIHSLIFWSTEVNYISQPLLKLNVFM